MKFNYYFSVYLLLFSVVLTGCAVSSAAIMDEERVTNTKPISQYRSLIINEFILKKDLLSFSTADSASEREKRYFKMPAEIAAAVERLVSERQIFTQVSRTIVPDTKSLILTGEFTRVSRFKISVMARLFDGETRKEVAFFRLTLWDVYDTSQTIAMLAKETSDFIDRIQYK